MEEHQWFASHTTADDLRFLRGALVKDIDLLSRHPPGKGDTACWTVYKAGVKKAVIDVHVKKMLTFAGASFSEG